MAQQKTIDVTKAVRNCAELFKQFGTFEDEEQRKQFFRDAHKGKKAAELAREQFAVQRVKEYLEDLLKLTNAEFDAIRIELLPTACENEGLEGFKLEGIGRVSLTADLYVKVPVGAMPQLVAWLKKNRLADLAQMTVNSSTLKSFVKSRIEAGKPIPEDFLNVTPYTRASITKS